MRRAVKGAGTACAPPGFEESAEVFARATRLAECLLSPATAHVTLVIGGAVWRSNDPEGRLEARPIITEWVMQRRRALWVPDARRDRRFRDHPFVTGPQAIRTVVAAPIRLEDGSIPGAVAVGSPLPRPRDPEIAGRIQDIADLVADEWRRMAAKRAEEASARESTAVRQVLSGVIRNAPLSLLMLDRDFRILAASRRWLTFRGLRSKDAIGRPLTEVQPQAKQWIAGFQRCLKGETIQSARGRIEMPDGSHRWARTEVTPWRHSTGEVGGILISSHDITQMVEALESSERSEERLKLAMELSDIKVWEMDNVRRELITVGADGTLFDKHRTYEDLAHDRWSMIDGRDRAQVKAAWERHLKEGAPYRPEYRIARGDGQEVWVQASSRMIHDGQGQLIRVVGALQNVTARKQVEQALLKAKEEAEAANLAKSAFLATMSHEIRTPLNGVLGMAQAMSQAELSDRQRQRLDVIRQSGEALLAILNDVLDLSKIEAGKLELEEAAFDVSEVVAAAHATFAATAQAKGVGFGLEVSRAAKGVYLGDAVRVRQILCNLVSNALKFTDRGGVKVRVGRRAGRLTLSVSDTGIGIAPDKLALLFRKFEQADASMTRRFGGTGLGLAICRELTELMGGSITAASQLGKGATFLVELPLARSQSRPRRAEPTSAPVAAARSALRVLAAEDNSMNQLVLRTLLAQVGIEPELVSDGRQAVEAWARGRWDLILMDVQRPEMDGPTAASIIRAREDAEGRARTPIVALTANVMAHQVLEYRAAGMDDFVAKPIEAARLYEALFAAVEGRDQGDVETAAA